MTNFCSKCGKPVNSEAVFCSNCGANLQSFEVNNTVNNKSLQNTSGNGNLSSNDTTPNQVINSTNNSESKLGLSSQNNSIYQQISLTALLTNLKEIPIGTKIRTGGYAKKNWGGIILDISLYADLKQLEQDGDYLFVDLNHISGKTRRKLSDSISKVTGEYLDITVEGQIEKSSIIGKYLEADNLYFEHFTCDNVNWLNVQATATDTQEKVSVNTSLNIIPNNNSNQLIVSQNQASNKSTKSRLVAALLQLFFGWFGLGWFYLGNKFRGFYDILVTFILLLFCGGYPIILCCIWDCIEIMIKSNLRDGKRKIVD